MHHIGIIGAGDYGAQHARALQAIDDARIVAASRTNAEALAQFTAEFGCQGFTDYHALLAQPDIDTVVIATPHHQHTPIALAAAQAGKHILLEKPMAPTLAECDQILAAALAAGVRLMVGHTNRFASTYRIAKALIESGDMGRVVMGTAAMQKFWFEPNRRDWHLDRTSGGGVWMTVGIHPLDRLIWLIDSPVETVSARFGTYFHEMQADDTGMVFLRHANGAASMVISTGYSTGAPKHTTELTCTKGMLSIDYATGVQIGREDRWQTLPESVPQGSWMHEALVAEWQGFSPLTITMSHRSPGKQRGQRWRWCSPLSDPLPRAVRSGWGGREIRLGELS